MGASHSPRRLPAGAEAPERAALSQATSDATEEATAQGVSGPGVPRPRTPPCSQDSGQAVGPEHGLRALQMSRWTRARGYLLVSDVIT